MRPSRGLVALALVLGLTTTPSFGQNVPTCTASAYAPVQTGDDGIYGAAWNGYAVAANGFGICRPSRFEEPDGLIALKVCVDAVGIGGGCNTATDGDGTAYAEARTFCFPGIYLTVAEVVGQGTPDADTASASLCPLILPPKQS
jgi:hypothetical protein